MKELLYAVLLLFGVFISSCSQVLLKKEAGKNHNSLWDEYYNFNVIVAYMLFVGATFLAIVAYRVVPLSFGPVLEASSYIYVTIFGVKIFHEKISRKRKIALFAIFLGIIVSCI